MMELKKEIESLNKGIADRDAQIEEAKQAFSDYMVSAHNKKLQELEKLKGELESKAAATNEELLGRFQKLKKVRGVVLAPSLPVGTCGLCAGVVCKCVRCPDPLFSFLQCVC